MRHTLLSTSFTSMATTPNHHHHHHNKKPSSSSNPNHHHHNHHSSTTTCSHHSPSATLDILILILVLFSATFLLSSYLSYLFHSLSLLLPPFSLSSLLHHSTPYLTTFFLLLFLLLLSILSVQICCGSRSRKCGKRGCKGLKKAMEFDLQLQTEDVLRSGGRGVKEVEDLPWKGGSEVNPDYECLRTELRKMAPVNGRAVLLFRLKCGCPVAKLEGWGPKRGRRNKKNLSLNHG